MPGEPAWRGRPQHVLQGSASTHDQRVDEKQDVVQDKTLAVSAQATLTTYRNGNPVKADFRIQRNDSLIQTQTFSEFGKF
jgi:hypothetical protein